MICTVPLLPGVGWPFQPRGKTHRRTALQTTPRTAHRALRTAHRAPRTVHRTPRIAHPRTRAPRTARHAETQLFFRRLVTIRSSFIYKYLYKYTTKGGGCSKKREGAPRNNNADVILNAAFKKRIARATQMGDFLRAICVGLVFCLCSICNLFFESCVQFHMCMAVSRGLPPSPFCYTPPTPCPLHM